MRKDSKVKEEHVSDKTYLKALEGVLEEWNSAEDNAAYNDLLAK